jgi:hypothetical protein
VLRHLAQRMTYANVIGTLALFIALGGTSYAVASLQRNSVGSRELKARSVGASELKPKAVASEDIRDRGVRLRDIATSARRALRGQTGPAGPTGPSGVTFFAIVNSGGRTSPSSVGSSQQGVNGQVLTFPRSVAGCAYSASLAVVGGGLVVDPPAGSSINVAPTAKGGVLVRTWGPAPNHEPMALPFHLIVAC